MAMQDLTPVDRRFSGRFRRELARLRAVTGQAEIGVFGGSGFYSFLEDVQEVEFDTPYGKPSAPFAIGEIGGKRVAFLPRHGRDHELPPAQIPYRANLWAMKELGVRRIIGPCASGALQADLELGEFVVVDQFVDRTRGRADTFYEGPETTHVSAADPYCPDIRKLLVETAGELGIKARDGGSVVVIQGPRFSTRAESRWFQQMGWDTINRMSTSFPFLNAARDYGASKGRRVGLRSVGSSDPITSRLRHAGRSCTAGQVVAGRPRPGVRPRHSCRPHGSPESSPCSPSTNAS